MWKKFITLCSAVFLLAAIAVVPSAHAGEPSDETFTLLSTVLGGKGNIWLPSVIVVDEGKTVQIKLRNIAGKAHGFSIDTLGIREVIPAGETKTISVKAKETGIFRYHCQLHGGHVGGQLVVH